MTDETATGDAPALPVPSVSGRWVKGQSGNPKGRPPADPDKIGTHALTHLKNKLEYAVRESVDPERIKRIVVKMCQLAEDGNVRAAKLILDKVVSNASGPTQEEPGDQSRTVVFQIENATFAAIQKNAAPVSDAVEVEVITVSTTPSEESK